MPSVLATGTCAFPGPDLEAACTKNGVDSNGRAAHPNSVGACLNLGFGLLGGAQG